MKPNEFTIEEFDCIPSTNEYAAQKRGEGKELIVVAKSQSKGKGTKGRSFSSQEGGVYLTRLSYPVGLEAKNTFCVMAFAAAAVCETLEAYGLSPVIKWANDVHVNGKKICGILVENTLRGVYVASSIVGIGLNVNNELEEELQSIATTMKAESGRAFDVKEVKNRLIENLRKERTMESYLSRIGYMGRAAELLVGDRREAVTLLSVDGQGGLWVKTAEGERRVTAAEVSLRLGGGDRE
ncbi:MAG: biotin--[Clostridia bacterium]|nr:biotin--[acetyl-CoA-carboxylase] ligase [Clostridia bacterium]